MMNGLGESEKFDIACLIVNDLYCTVPELMQGLTHSQSISLCKHTCSDCLVTNFSIRSGRNHDNKDFFTSGFYDKCILFYLYMNN